MVDDKICTTTKFGFTNFDNSEFITFLKKTTRSVTKLAIVFPKDAQFTEIAELSIEHTGM